MIAQPIVAAKEPEVLSYKKVFDFSEILSAHGVSFKPVDFYYQVGEIIGTQGWLLHLSVVRCKIAEVLSSLLPTLLEYQLPFRIVQNMEIARSIMDGLVGLEKVGKVITIFPTSPTQTLDLAMILVKLTAQVDGPKVPTDAHLGGVVYTRYGAFNPILVYDDVGVASNHIYDHDRKLIPDRYTVPFELPDGTQWPFGSLASPDQPKLPNILDGKYKIMEVLKADPKGNVFKAIYQKSLLKVKSCVIKQGVSYMWSDENGRDMIDRLKWQKHLHSKLTGHIRLPAIIDLFYLNGDGFLAMEWIDGISVYDYANMQNPECRSWPTIKLEVQLQIIDYLIQMVAMIGRMHSLGIIHRDITPVNFMIDRTRDLCMIDIELAYDFKEEKKLPAYDLGSAGYMSPEQEKRELPIFESDIYGLGATIVTILTGLPPQTFDLTNSETFAQSLSFFIGDEEVSHMLADSMQTDPGLRVSIAKMKAVLTQYRSRLKEGVLNALDTSAINILLKDDLHSVIQAAIRGLSSPPTVMLNNLWQSRNVTGADSQQAVWMPTHRFFDGVCGTLFLLAKAKKAGFSIDANMASINEGWKYVYNTFLKGLPNVPPGLYGGAAGVALTMHELMDTGILESSSENITLMQQCIELPVRDCTVATGLAGQGLALLGMHKLYDQSLWQNTLKTISARILAEQQASGTWITTQDSQGIRHSASFAEGNSGIICFLLQLSEIIKDNHLRAIGLQALNILQSEIPSLKKVISKYGMRNLMATSENIDTIIGLLQTIVYAGAITEPSISYKQNAEEIIEQLPAQFVLSNFSLFSGLSRIGLYYLHCYNKLGIAQCKERADWLSSILMHLQKSGSKGSSYWQPGNAGLPTADLMNGNAGILYFFIEIYKPENGENFIIL